jgi:hypothetical protein
MSSQTTAWTWKVVDGDVVRSYTNTGYTSVSGKDKVRQDVACIVATDMRDSTGLGCSLGSSIGIDVENPASAFAITPVAFDFQMKVQTGMNRLMAAQKNYQSEYRTDEELISSSGPVQIWQLQADPRNFGWLLPVSTIAGGKANFALNGETRG